MANNELDTSMLEDQVKLDTSMLDNNLQDGSKDGSKDEQIKLDTSMLEEPNKVSYEQQTNNVQQNIKPVQQEQITNNQQINELSPIPTGGNKQREDLKAMAANVQDTPTFSRESWLRRNLQKSALEEQQKIEDYNNIPLSDSLKTFGREFKEAAIPTAAGVAAGAGAGILASKYTGPAAPYVAPVAALAGGILGSSGIAAVQDYLVKKILREEGYKDYQKIKAEGEAQNSYMATIGRVTPGLLAFRPSISATKTIWNFAKEALTQKGLKQTIIDNPQGFQATLNSVLGSGTQMGQVAYNRIVNGSDESLGQDVIAIVLAAVGQKETPFMRAAMLRIAQASSPEYKEGIKNQKQANKDVKNVFEYEIGSKEHQDLVNNLNPQARELYNSINKHYEKPNRNDPKYNDPNSPYNNDAKFRQDEFDYNQRIKDQNEHITQPNDNSYLDKLTRVIDVRRRLQEANLLNPTGPIAKDLAARMDGVDNISQELGFRAGNDLRKLAPITGQNIDKSEKTGFISRPATKRNLDLEAATVLMSAEQNIKDNTDMFGNTSKDINLYFDEALKKVNSIKYSLFEGGDKVKNNMIDAIERARYIASKGGEDYNRIQKITKSFKDRVNSQELEETQSGVDSINKRFLLNSDASFNSSGKSGKQIRNDIFDHLINSAEDKKVNTLNLADLLERRIIEGQRELNSKAFYNTLENIIDPVSKIQIGRKIVKDASGNDIYFNQKDQTSIDPVDYSKYDILDFGNNNRLAIKKDLSGYFKHLSGFKQFSPEGSFKATLLAEKFIKSGKLLLDTYHLSKMALYKYASTGNFGDVEKILRATNHSKDTIKDLVKIGEITPEEALVALNHQDIIDKHTKFGLNISKIAESLQSDFFTKSDLHSGPLTLNMFERFNKYLFEHYVKAAMSDVAVHQYSQLKEAHFKDNKWDKDWSEQRALRENVSNINTLFGTLRRQGLLSSKESGAFSRILLLAPQWVEASVRREVGAIGQAGSFLKDIAVNRGNIGKAWSGKTLLQMESKALLMFFAASQIMNFAFRGHSTLDNKEEEHKYDAYIPNFAKGEGDPEGYFLSPLSMPAELSHDVVRYMYADDSPTRVERFGNSLIKIASNKLSPVVRASTIALTGDTGMGTKVKGLRKAGAVAGELSPIPIGISGLMPDAPTFDLQKQLLTSLGIKTEVETKPISEISKLAREFNKKNGKEPTIEIDPIEGTGYLQLKKELKGLNQITPVNNLTQFFRNKRQPIYNALDKLRETKTDEQILKSFEDSISHPFTGNSTSEDMFILGLNKYQRELYDKAKQDKLDNLKKIVMILEEHPNTVLPKQPYEDYNIE